MATNATITVYLQALGGKFLGPNAYHTDEIEVTLTYSGGEIKMPYQLVTGVTDDGIISQGFTAGTSSFLPILHMAALSGQNPDVFYLTPGSKTIAANGSISLPAINETAMLSVKIPSPSVEKITISQAVLLSPQQTEYTITVVVPGLLLTLNTAAPIAGSISVFVTMMCGCRVTAGLPTSFWTASDFTVTAVVLYSNGLSMPYTLSLNEQTNNSLFSTVVADETLIESVSFTAQQKSTGNYGAIVQLMKQ